MSKTFLPSLAILKSNWDEGGRSYIDYFVPFVADCMRTSEQPQMTVDEVATAVRVRFGIAIPEGVVNTILRRAARGGLGKRQHGAFVIDQEAVARFNLDTERSAAVRRVNALVDRLKRFAARTTAELTPALGHRRAPRGLAERGDRPGSLVTTTHRRARPTKAVRSTARSCTSTGRPGPAGSLCPRDPRPRLERGVRRDSGGWRRR